MSSDLATPPPHFSANARLRALQTGIMDLILERELSPGDPLPTENDLSLALRVGRNTLRESLKVLQALGVVDIRHGFGMFVAANNFAALADGLTFRGRLALRHEGHEALELIEARQQLESSLIGAAMDLATEAHIVELQSAVVVMEEAAAGAHPSATSGTDFHQRLFAPLDNPILLDLMSAFRDVSEALRTELGPMADEATGSAVEHRKIFEAFKSGDKETTARLLNDHFAGIRASIASHIGDRQTDRPVNSP